MLAQNAAWGPVAKWLLGCGVECMRGRGRWSRDMGFERGHVGCSLGGGGGDRVYVGD